LCVALEAARASPRSRSLIARRGRSSGLMMLGGNSSASAILGIGLTLPCSATCARWPLSPVSIGCVWFRRSSAERLSSGSRHSSSSHDALPTHDLAPSINQNRNRNGGLSHSGLRRGLVIVRYLLDGVHGAPIANRLVEWGTHPLFAGPRTRRDDHAQRDANDCACRLANRKGAGGEPAIHFTICSQAIVIKYPYSGIFYS
jgi:hypothetical protein